MNIHIYPSPFLNETRILKIVESIRHAGFFSSILILALWKPGLPKNELIEKQIQVIRIVPFIKENLDGNIGRCIKILGWHLGALFVLRGKRVTCINCHSLSVLPLAVFIKFWKRCALIYEPHELETETAGLRGFRQVIAKILEHNLIKFADAVCVVNRSIADWYTEHYRLKKIWIVRNVPNVKKIKRSRTGLLRKALGLDSTAELFLYQGLLAPGRGIPMMIEAFSEVSQNRHLVFMGYGELESLVREASNRFINIHFLPAVPPEKLLDYTGDADVGLAIIENVCLSYYLCLPNKLFEYTACGVPTIVSKFPEMERFVDKLECGWKIAPSTKNLRNLIISLTPEELASKSANTIACRELDCWLKEAKKLLEIYQSLGFKLGGRV